MWSATAGGAVEGRKPLKLLCLFSTEKPPAKLA
jgi:hypothetical protein